MKLTSSNAFSRQDLILKGYSHLKLLDIRERKDFGVTKESGQNRCWSS